MSDFKSESDGWLPAFRKQRPPFAEGNQWRAKPGDQLHLQSGAFSRRHVEPLARQIVEELYAIPSLNRLRAPRWTGLVWRYARAEARYRLYSEWLELQPFDFQMTTKRKNAPTEILRQLLTTTIRLADKLGLTPLGAQQLADEQTDDQPSFVQDLSRQRAESETDHV